MGIDRTTDPLVIRRAYGSKLRGLNVETDPAGFMALRSALEGALQLANYAAPEPASTVDNDPDYDFYNFDSLDDVSPPQAHPVYEPQGLSEQPYNDRTSGDRANALSQILAARGVKAGWDYYTMLMARGDIALDDQTSFAMLVLERAVDPKLLPAPDFLMIYDRLGLEHSPWRFEGRAALQAQVQSRVAALHWLEKLRALAAKRARKNEKYEVLAARLFLHQRRWLRSKGALLEALTRMFAVYHSHAVWLSGDVDTAWLSSLEGRVQRAIRLKKRNAKIVLTIIFIALFADILGVFTKSIVDFFTSK
ncbi:MAG: hypothetical protein B7Z75_12850 [Acidocella sp. 20-57-95]|nr:MAG: hypothetical protein B7Z75_12850 [Acidocella sp. 20-57-95]OYV60872.1 MAG: hypothetical protein B7Z71_05530 [Acidocella sp. 21-58-7]